MDQSLPNRPSPAGSAGQPERRPGAALWTVVRAAVLLAGALAVGALLAGCGADGGGGDRAADAAADASPSAPAAATGPPGAPRAIIVLDVDTLRADALGIYGSRRPTSPRLDAWAEDAVVFDWAFSQAPNTPPSQTSIFTGLYPSTHGMVYDEDRVPQAAVTLAEALSGAGWATAAFVDGGYMARTWGHDQGYDLYRDVEGLGLRKIVPQALDWVEDHLEDEPDRPFFLVLHTYDVHTPYAPPEPFRSRIVGDLTPATPGFEPTSEALEAVRLSFYTKSPQPLPEGDLEYARALYDAGVAYADDQLGRFLDGLAEQGVLEDALVVLISDHGEEFGEHGSVLHEKLYTTVTRVPLVLRFPDGLGAGQRHPEVVETVDLMPTLLEAVGVAVPEAVQGQSLMPLIRGEDLDTGEAHAEFPYSRWGPTWAVADGDLHMIVWHNPRRPPQVYAFREDPLELQDRYGDHQDTARQLRRTLNAWIARTRALAIRGDDAVPPEEIDESTLEQLKALGYLQ